VTAEFWIWGRLEMEFLHLVPTSLPHVSQKSRDMGIRQVTLSAAKAVLDRRKR